ncbi:MAG TPA: hypothetical protein VM163_13795 [bacterium]|nr:hypothetical protein [bacterium]
MQRKNRRRKASRRKLHKEQRLKLMPLVGPDGESLNAYQLATGKRQKVGAEE